MVTKIKLGSEERVRKLFSYPPNENDIFALDKELKPVSEQRLVDTVQHYLEGALRRDSFTDDTVTVRRINGDIVAVFEGAAGKAYSTVLRDFLAAGDKAYNKSVELA